MRERPYDKGVVLGGRQRLMIGGESSLSVLRDNSSVIAWTAGGRNREDKGGKECRGDMAERGLTLSFSFYSPEIKRLIKISCHTWAVLPIGHESNCIISLNMFSLFLNSGKKWHINHRKCGSTFVFSACKLKFLQFTVHK